MMGQAHDWISVARISRFVGRGQYHVTVGGDGLSTLRLPARLATGEAAAQGSSKPDGPTVLLQSLTLRGSYGRAQIESDAELPKGTELYARKEDLRAAAGPGEVFWFEIEGLPVFTEPSGIVAGTVTALYETGAHGIIEVTTEEGKVLVPFVDAYVQIDLTERRALIPQLDDFRA